MYLPVSLPSDYWGIFILCEEPIIKRARPVISKRAFFYGKKRRNSKHKMKNKSYSICFSGYGVFWLDLTLTYVVTKNYLVVTRVVNYITSSLKAGRSRGGLRL